MFAVCAWTQIAVLGLLVVYMAHPAAKSRNAWTPRGTSEMVGFLRRHADGHHAVECVRTWTPRIFHAAEYVRTHVDSTHSHFSHFSHFASHFSHFSSHFSHFAPHFSHFSSHFPHFASHSSHFASHSSH